MSVYLNRCEASETEMVLAWMQEFSQLLHLPWDEDRRRENIAYLTAHPEAGSIMVLKREGESIGYAALASCYSLEFGGATVFLDELYVVRTHRGTGAGREALLCVEAYAAEKGLRRVLLESAAGDARLLHFYEKAGYAPRSYHLCTKRICDESE